VNDQAPAQSRGVVYGPTPTIGRPWVLLLVASLYLGLGLLSFQATVTDRIVTPTCFYPEGMALAASIALGPWIWPGVFVGQFLLAAIHGLPLPAAVAIATVNSVEAVAAHHLFRRLELQSDLRRLRDLTGLLDLIFLVLQPFSASLGTLTLWLAEAIEGGSHAFNTWLSW
jgi:integral membrane sensor domain MASE1